MVGASSRNFNFRMMFLSSRDISFSVKVSSNSFWCFGLLWFLFSANLQAILKQVAPTLFRSVVLMGSAQARNRSRRLAVRHRERKSKRRCLWIQIRWLVNSYHDAEVISG
ncbi:hypothetical protein XENTR_v10020727 [Xenopus tropicalis]|nr:hypothetical protein XENTR_v10020727 [Xenopus tropicalis]